MNSIRWLILVADFVWKTKQKKFKTHPNKKFLPIFKGRNKNNSYNNIFLRKITHQMKGKISIENTENKKVFFKVFPKFWFFYHGKNYQAWPTESKAMLANDANLFYLIWHVKTGLKAYSKSYQGDVVVFAFKF